MLRFLELLELILFGIGAPCFMPQGATVPLQDRPGDLDLAVSDRIDEQL